MTINPTRKFVIERKDDVVCREIQIVRSFLFDIVSEGLHFDLATTVIVYHTIVCALVSSDDYICKLTTREGA